MKHFLFLFLLILSFCSCKQISGGVDLSNITIDKTQEDNIEMPEAIERPISHHFDFPVGKPDAKGYYNAQSFGKNDHLGDDWNAVTGGNSDLGDPIYSIGNGTVTFAKDIGGGWGNVIKVRHQLPDDTYVESLYAHCDSLLVSKSDVIKKGDQIATIGTANGAYLAHLHLEIRDDMELPIGNGYSSTTDGYLNPTAFIEKHR